MTLENIKQGLKLYYKNNLLTLDWKMLFIEPVFNKAIDNIERKYSSIFELVTEEDGSIDIESLYCNYKKNMETLGHIEILGIKFNSSDLEKLYNYIKETEVKHET